MIGPIKRIKLPRQARLHPKPFRVVYNDQHLIVADKSAGILTVPIPGANAKNLKDFLDVYLAQQKKHAITVHRIDRYTSGLVVFAKSEKARDHLVAQFKAHTPTRIYYAVVRGNPPEEGTLRHNLMLGRTGFRQYAVRTGGTPAVTHFRVLERIGDVSVLEVRLETGLKNQIRVQFMEAGYPLVGDRHYEPAEAQEKLLDRQALHSWKLGFIHPITGKGLEFESIPSPDIRIMLEKLRRRTMKEPDRREVAQPADRSDAPQTVDEQAGEVTPPNRAHHRGQKPNQKHAARNRRKRAAEREGAK